MILFAREKFLLLLILVPLIPVVYGLMRYFRRRRMLRFGDEALVRELMPSWSRSKGWVRVSLLALAFFFFVIGLARPQIGSKLTEKKTRGAEIMIALDVSNSMLAEDYSPNRLERAKLSISRITDRLKDDRVGLIIFAGTSFVQLPITTDYVSAKMFLSNITTESVPVQGTALADAILTSLRSFSAQSEKSRVIILISDGENHEDDPVAAAKQAAEMGVKIYTIGVGSPEGQPIPMGGELLRDSSGEIVVTKLDEDILRKIAKASGGAYVRAGKDEFGLNPIINDIRRLEDEEFNSTVFEEYDEQYMYFFAIALALFILEMLIGQRRSGRHLFRREEI
ncbi:MAG: VWA domain-containing protein [Bacteroidales bacterium]|nr:VWA domain-containing protein [Bacteroidales bacterium]